MPALLARLDARPSRWLALGIVLLFLSQISHTLGVLAWIAPVPWLRHLRVTSGIRSRLAFGGALVAAWTLAVLKQASDLSLTILAPLFALPIALAHGVVFAAWLPVSRGGRPLLAPAFYALGLATAEIAVGSLTELGTWGAIGYTQLDDLLLLECASLVGLAGVGAVVSFVGASIETAIAGTAAERGRPLALALGVALAAHGLGATRLWLAPPSPLLAVAMVGTDSDVSGPPLPDRETAHRWDASLLARTRAAAAGGAELVVWTEAAALVWPDEEEAWLAAVAETARTASVDVVAASVVPVSLEPFRYRNQLHLVRRDGTIEEAYLKHHPVPGEPALAGTGAAPRYAMAWGTLSVAICYDDDFPATGRARSGAGIVAVPASDWRGIDPVHAEMAAVRAIESGHSLVRSTRFGLTLAADAYGRVRASRSSFEAGPAITFALVPRQPVSTLYASVGDVPLLAAFAVALVLAFVRARRTTPAASGGAGSLLARSAR